MSSNAIPTPDQGDFLECYRGRQGWLNHAAYMRMSKVLLALHACKEAGIQLENKDVLDYGFGAGTFFRYCPPSARLFGVEIDPLNVQSVRAMLEQRGVCNTDLRTIEIENWAAHELLQREYDIILCSHVLEHLPRPVEFLERMRACLKPDGVFIALVPLNERKMDPHHVQPVSSSRIRAWARAAGLRVKFYCEADPWIYWLQPLFTHSSGWPHKIAQGISLAVGFPATLMGAEAWFRFSRFFSAVTRSKPTQAAFVLRRGPIPRCVLPDPVESRRRKERKFTDDKDLET